MAVGRSSDVAQMLRARASDADAHEVAESLRALGRRSPWLRPLVLAGNTLDALVRAVLVLLTTARLTLVELVPAVWIGAITWDWRVHASGELPLPEVHGTVVALVVVGVVLANLAAYWCNATLTFALLQPPPIEVRGAFAHARRHGALITSWALAIGTAHAFVSVVLSRTTVGWFGLGSSVIAIAQLYAIVALPVALAGLPRRHLPIRQRAVNAAVVGAITVVALAPGFALNRLALLLIGVGLPPVGFLLLVIAVLVQVAATSSAHTVTLATKVNVIAGTDNPDAGSSSDERPHGSTNTKEERP